MSNPRAGSGEASTVDELYKRVQPEIKQLVRDEVDRVAAQSEAEFQAAMQRAVRSGGRPALSFAWPHPTWRQVVLGLCVACVLVLAGRRIMYGTFSLLPSQMTDGPVVGGKSADGDAAAGEDRGPGARSAFEFALAGYDSLFKARAAEFDSLSAQAGAASPALDSLLAAWKRGEVTQPQQDTVHDAFVQATLRSLGHSSLKVDGDIQREPCGTTCKLVLAYWQGDLSKVHLVTPAPPTAGEVFGDQLRDVEKLLVYLHVVAPRP